MYRPQLMHSLFLVIGVGLKAKASMPPIIPNIDAVKMEKIRIIAPHLICLMGSECSLAAAIINIIDAISSQPPIPTIIFSNR